MKLKLWNTKGIILEQKKEPALSRDLQQFTSSQPTAPAIEPMLRLLMSGMVWSCVSFSVNGKIRSYRGSSEMPLTMSPMCPAKPTR